MAAEDPTHAADAADLSTVYDTDDVLAYIQARNEQAALAELARLDAQDDVVLPPADSLAPPERGAPRRATLLGLDGYQWSVVLALFMTVIVLSLALAVRLVMSLTA